MPAASNPGPRGRTGSTHGGAHPGGVERRHRPASPLARPPLAPPGPGPEAISPERDYPGFIDLHDPIYGLEDDDVDAWPPEHQPVGGNGGTGSSRYVFKSFAMAIEPA